jgi:hypothetical protein
MDWLHAMPNFTDRRCIAQPIEKRLSDAPPKLARRTGADGVG